MLGVATGSPSRLAVAALVKLALPWLAAGKLVSP